MMKKIDVSSTPARTNAAEPPRAAVRIRTGLRAGYGVAEEEGGQLKIIWAMTPDGKLS